MNKEDRAQKVLACARASHEVNRAYCISIGDGSQVAWDGAPGWQKQSAMNGVEAVLRGALPEELHTLWMEEKTHNGWVYGETKDPEKKTHPCMLPYTELPEAQRVKDMLFHHTVSCMLVATGLLLSRG